MAAVTHNTVLKVRYFVANNREMILKTAFPIKNEKLKKLEDLVVERTKGRIPLFPFFIDEQIVMFPVNEKARMLCCRVTLTGTIRIESDMKSVNLVTPLSVSYVSLYNELIPLSHYDMTVLDESSHDASVKAACCVHFRIELNVISFGCVHGLRSAAHTCPTCSRLYICPSCHEEQAMHSIIEKKRNDINGGNREEKEEEEKENICLICGNVFKREEKDLDVCPKCGVKLFTNILSDNIKGIYNENKEITNEGGEAVECPICQTPVDRGYELVMQCGHILHQECYKEHLRFGNHQCPLCRKICFSRYDTVLKWEEATRALIKAGVIDQGILVSHKCHECGSIGVGKMCTVCGSCNTQVVKE